MDKQTVRDTLHAITGLKDCYRALMLSALDSGGKSALKTWIANHDVLNTLQVQFTADGRPRSAWWPGPREVDTSAASYVLLNGSRTDYREVKCISSSRDAWVGQYDDGTLVIHITL